jgi:hypothetical protein
MNERRIRPPLLPSPHEAALGELGRVPGLGADAVLVSVGVVAVDGNEFAASPSDRVFGGYEQIARAARLTRSTSSPAIGLG